MRVGSRPLVANASSRATRAASRRIAASASAMAAPGAGTQRTTTFAVPPHGLRSEAGPAMSISDAGSSSASG